MSNYLQIEIEISTPEAADILIAELSEVGFYAFQQEENKLFAYIGEKDFDEEKVKAVLPGTQYFNKIIIEDKNWNQQWESDFQPVIFNDFVAIRADFHPPVKNVEHDIIITPKMSFGTGHHATTYLMVTAMQRLDFKGRNVLDFGCGTAVLSILAEKCGAGKITAIDNDEWSINNSTENIKSNNCKRIAIHRKDNLEGLNEVDIVLANITLNVLTGSVTQLSKILCPGGLLLTSGFLKEDEAAMMRAFGSMDFVKVFSIERKEWLAILFKKSK